MSLTYEQKVNLSKNIIGHLFNTRKTIFMTFSGGKDSTVLLDLVSKVSSDFKVIGIDTRFEFPETIEFTNRMIKKYNLDFQYVIPTTLEHEKIMEYYAGENIKDGQWYCCAHKEPALESFLVNGNHDTWITGLRSDETENRRYIGIYQTAKCNILKVNPIIFWTLEDIWHYIKTEGLEYHPMYDKGFKSLGCKPCTEAGFREGKGAQSKFEDVGLSHERGGNTECGIHL